jgi:hypothetical protein
MNAVVAMNATRFASSRPALQTEHAQVMRGDHRIARAIAALSQ